MTDRHHRHRLRFVMTIVVTTGATRTADIEATVAIMAVATEPHICATT